MLAAVSNHVIEATMVIFVLLSVEWQLKPLLDSNTSRLWFFAAGLAILAAGLCKGVQGMFALVAAPAFALTTQEATLRRGMTGFLRVLFVVVIGIVLLWWYEPARDNFIAYYHRRIERTFFNALAETTTNRFFLLKELLLNLIAPLGIISFIAWKNPPRRWRRSVFFIALGFCGTLPLLVTLEQRSFYIATAMPFYALALALLTAQPVARFLHSGRLAVWAKISGLLIGGTTIVVTIYLADRPKRYAVILNDVYAIGARLVKRVDITTTDELFKTWALHMNLARHYQIGLTNVEKEYLLLPQQDTPPPNYEKIRLPLQCYQLLQKSNK